MRLILECHGYEPFRSDLTAAVRILCFFGLLIALTSSYSAQQHCASPGKTGCFREMQPS